MGQTVRTNVTVFTVQCVIERLENVTVNMDTWETDVNNVSQTFIH